MPQNNRKSTLSDRSAARNEPGFDPAVLMSLTVPSEPHILCAVRNAITSLADATGLAPADGRSLARAVDEALANVIRHAYQSRRDQPIHITCRRIDDPVGESRIGLEITLVDYGPAFDPTQQVPRSLDEVRPGGLGLHFMREAVELSYRRARRTNRLRMVKFARPTPATRGGL
jgi:serine/threonine-protein kinase RsbW